MEFNEELKKHFSADQGAYSVVTKREATGDKSITYDKDEKAILHSKIPRNRFTRAGGAEHDGKPSEWKLQVFDAKTGTYQSQDIVIKYPKHARNELRQYFRKGTGFYPNTGDVAFIFTKEGLDDIFIGHLPKAYWNNLASSASSRASCLQDYNLDKHDAEYQKAIHAPIAKANDKTISGKKATRNATIGAEAIKRAGYKCEFNPDHESFISRSSDMPYVEAHHLIPLGVRHDFENSLDVSANIISLCPLCHAKIHFSEINSRREIISNLFNQRSGQLDEAGISVTLEKLYEYYSVPK